MVRYENTQPPFGRRVGAVKVRELIGEEHLAQSDWARMYKIDPCKA